MMEGDVSVYSSPSVSQMSHISCTGREVQLCLPREDAAGTQACVVGEARQDKLHKLSF